MLEADFSNFLSAIMFSCKMKMELFRCWVEETIKKDAWCLLVQYILSSIAENRSSSPLGIQFPDFY
jgi:hypothetical protein